ncbi:hypothetical protein O181_097106 [Austropuccinia psidii MF-1]|uniref:Uncharacterized protein n=1 Tax=Austropuccinia psidii MF-1 TaxID=1389203 RepID=A0A9Q3PET4_9BASI|nr:hypothetical protein [Austropuccinia psidii MF-1]
MAHVRWHATVHLSWFLGLVQDPAASQAIPYAFPGSQCVTLKALCCKSLCRGSLPIMPTTPHACPGSQCFTCKILTPVQAPDNSNNCLCQGSLETASTLPYVGSGTRRFTPKYLCLCRFLTAQRIAYARAGFQQFACKSLLLYRFPKLTKHILMLVQVPNISDHSLQLGSLPKILKIPSTTKINSM